MRYVGAGLMIREPKGTYLFVRRSQDPQHWEMPGGHRDKGETDPYLTAIRETKEELGRVPLHKIDFADNHPSGRKLPFWAFFVDVKRKFSPKLSDEHVDYRWMTIDEALSDPLPMHPKLKATLLAHQLPNGRLMSASFTVPENVRKAAQKGLDLRAKQPAGKKAGLTPQQAGKLGIGSGVARARDLISGRVSYDTVKRMKAYFARHAKNYKLDPGKRPVDDKGYVAGLLWGGEPGRVWANKIVRQNQ